MLSVPAPPPVTPATAYYTAALERMKQIREPRYAAYHAAVDVINGTVFAHRASNGALFFVISSGYDGSAHIDLSVVIVSDSPTYAVQVPGDAAAGTRLALLKATWNGIDDWIRYGFEGDPTPATPRPSQTPPPDSGRLRVIASVASFGVAYYDVSDAGPSRCTNGDPGREMVLSPRGDAFKHPLRGATIDETTGLFCTMSFIAPVVALPGIAAGANVQVHLARVDGYYMATDERLDLVGDAAVGGATDHVTATITFDHFTFPNHM